MAGQVGTRSVRSVVKALGRTADNAREMQRRHDQIREKWITVGDRVGLIEFESGDAVAPDGDLLVTGAWFSASTTYVYTV